VGISPGPWFVVSREIPANGVRLKAGETIALADLTPDIFRIATSS
jgi:hypothetical protein